ncbi:hypothetical protein N7495_001627 [Penicillium taxi]|uniref:uncharacterized protein n=1 Tax=Penicillium taxi TaxID=168475 RepID=UPI00254525CA|nr:uncharacterized protein N7495_001627 [Penicillium taxi]KAJ5908945.1 hypothetical protein N7495_001627 [Penicillium taxi]
MPLITESHDSLPYVDAELSTSERQSAEQLIKAELSPEHRQTLHPSIPAAPEFKFSPLIQQEIERKTAGTPITGGIDLSRYEAPEAPTSSDEPNLAEWRQALQKAYASSLHLSKRHENLALLEENGKNAWLIGNSQLEDILRDIEKELAETKQATEEVNKERKIAQENAQAELIALNQTWQTGLSSLRSVELATDGIKWQIMGQRRQIQEQQEQL